MKANFTLMYRKMLIVFVILILVGCTGVDVRSETTPETAVAQNGGTVESTKILSPTVTLSPKPEATETETPTLPSRSPVWESEESGFRTNEVYTLLLDPQGGLWAGGGGWSDLLGFTDGAAYQLCL